MTDDDLRSIVREAIAKHLGGPAASASLESSAAVAAVPPWRAHASFGKFLVSRGDQEGGSCIIEPTVHCNHCGFCQSYGH